MKRIITLPLVVLLLFVGCSFSDEKPRPDKQSKFDESEKEASVILEGETAEEIRAEVLAEYEVPVIEEVNYAGDAPLYFYLFTHTEDHINHELSEERYWRIGEMIEKVVQANPGLDLTWVLEFQGADARTVAERNAEGVADYIRELMEEGLVEVGYHAHHDPSYNNRPQKGLKVDSSYEEVYNAISNWVSCEKDPLKGGCVADGGGGIEAIAEFFGEPQVVTGVGTIGEVLIERSAGSQAIAELLPDRLLGFGFADHGASMRIPGYEETRDAFMNLMAPNNDTSSGAFWLDNTIRINDGLPLQGLGTVNLLGGVKDVVSSLEQIERSGAELMNTFIASKYIYTQSGTSPTKWAYAHTDDPELPADMLFSAAEIERNYANTEEGLNALVDFVVETESEASFVNSNEVIELYTSEDYWNIDDEELQNMNAWFLSEWDDAPPAWVYDGEDYYSLSDYFYFLLRSFDVNREISGLSGEEIMREYFGPWELGEMEVSEVSVNRKAFMDMISKAEFENSLIPSGFKFEGGVLEPMQVLYAMALHSVYADIGVKSKTLDLPAMTCVPETYDQLSVLGCEACLDTAWSLKPARFQE